VTVNLFIINYLEYIFYDGDFGIRLGLALG